LTKKIFSSIQIILVALLEKIFLVLVLVPVLVPVLVSVLVSVLVAVLVLVLVPVPCSFCACCVPVLSRLVLVS